MARARALVTHPWLPLALTWLILLTLLVREEAVVGLLAVLGFGGAFLSGLVGVGGAIVMIPLLLYVPPALGFDPIGIKIVSGITIAQVTAAAVAGVLGHLREQYVDRGLLVYLGSSMTAASLLGALLSGIIEGRLIEAVFATMALAAAAMMLLLRGRTVPEAEGTPAANPPLAIALGLFVGFLAGIVGAGGAFLLIPLMLYVLRVPMRVTVGTSLGVVAISAIAGLVGKAVTGQVDWLLALGLVVGALPGGRLGAYVSRRTRTERLVVVLGIVIALVALRMWLEILG